MICIYAKASVKRGCTDAFLKTAEALINYSRAEAGNISYHLGRENENRYVFMEIWKDDAAVASHMASTHFLEAGAKLDQVLETPLEIHKLQGVL